MCAILTNEHIKLYKLTDEDAEYYTKSIKLQEEKSIEKKRKRTESFANYKQKKIRESFYIPNDENIEARLSNYV